MDGWMDGWMGVFMYVCMHVCMYEYSLAKENFIRKVIIHNENKILTFLISEPKQGRKFEGALDFI